MVGGVIDSPYFYHFSVPTIQVECYKAAPCRDGIFLELALVPLLEKARCEAQMTLNANALSKHLRGRQKIRFAEEAERSAECFRRRPTPLPREQQLKIVWVHGHATTHLHSLPAQGPITEDRSIKCSQARLPKASFEVRGRAQVDAARMDDLDVAEMFAAFRDGNEALFDPTLDDDNDEERENMVVEPLPVLLGGVEAPPPRLVEAQRNFATTLSAEPMDFFLAVQSGDDAVVDWVRRRIQSDKRILISEAAEAIARALATNDFRREG